jgi:DNA modification methylase
MSVRILVGDCLDVLRGLPDESVHCCVTSPPYWGLRDYGEPGQLGLEATPEEYVANMVGVFREVRRVLRDDGTLWLNLGDSYGGAAGNTRGDGAGGGAARGDSMGFGAISRVKAATRSKDLVGIPWRVAFALQADGWWLRQDIIWQKPNPMPESVRDRCTKAHEYVFLLSKSARYHYDADAIAEGATCDRIRGPAEHPDAVSTNGNGGLSRRGIEPTRNRRSVWSITTKPFSEAHFATFPPELPEICIKAGCPEGGTVLDPFGGAGTTGLVADRLKRDAILIELNPEYAAMAERRIRMDAPMFVDVRIEAE